MVFLRHNDPYADGRVYVCFNKNEKCFYCVAMSFKQKMREKQIKGNY